MTFARTAAAARARGHTGPRHPAAQPEREHMSQYPPTSDPYGAAMPTPYAQAPVAQSQSPLVALLCGIGAWLGGGPVLAIPAVIFGRKGMNDADAGRTPDRGMAALGFWLGVANLIVCVLAMAVLLALTASLFVR